MVRIFHKVYCFTSPYGLNTNTKLKCPISTRQNEIDLSMVFHKVPLHKVDFLVGVILMGGILLVEQVDLLGLHGIAAEPLVMEGWTSPEELTAKFSCVGGTILSFKTCRLRLLISKADRSDLKGCSAKELLYHHGIVPGGFHSFPSDSNLK